MCLFTVHILYISCIFNYYRLYSDLYVSFFYRYVIKSNSSMIFTVDYSNIITVVFSSPECGDCAPRCSEVLFGFNAQIRKLDCNTKGSNKQNFKNEKSDSL